MVKDKYRRRVEGDDQCSGDQTDRVEKIHHLKGHESRDKGKEKDAVTESSERLIIKTLRPLPFPEENSIKEVDRGPHGAEPSAEEISEDHHKKQYTKTGKHSEDDILLGEDGDDPDEGIETKVEINRDPQLKGKSSLKNEIEKEAERDGLNRPPQVRDGSLHVALTFLTRTFERSIWPNPNS